MRDAAIAAAAAFVAEFRRLLPHRCFAPYVPLVKAGLIAIDDHIRPPAFWTALRVKEPERWRSLVKLQAYDERTVRALLPYRMEEIVREARIFTMTTCADKAYLSRFVFTEETAAEAARVVRRVSRLPRLDPLDALLDWRIV